MSRETNDIYETETSSGKQLLGTRKKFWSPQLICTKKPAASPAPCYPCDDVEVLMKMAREFPGDFFDTMDKLPSPTKEEFFVQYCISKL